MTDKSQSDSQQPRQQRKDEEQEQQQEEQSQQGGQPQQQANQEGSTHPGIPTLTAEWVVRAQLTISRPGESVTREFTTTKPTNPVKVVYRYNSSDGAQDEDKQRSSSHETLVGSGQSTPSKTRVTQTHAESFNSTTSAGGGDSAFSGSNTSRNKQQQQKQTSQSLYGTRCRSTCNIIVSAVADFLPSGVASSTIPEETDPFVFNTTACYTVLPEKPPDGASPPASKNFTSGKILALRDAFSQTSDTEIKFLGPREYSRSPPYDRRSSTDDYRRQQRRSYDHYRRATDTLCPPPPSPVQASTASAAAYVDEGNSFTPSYTPSPTQTCKSASLPRIPPLPGHQRHLYQQQYQQQQPASGPKSESKKPRTVHIDVYCTGSDDEDDDELDIDESTSSSDANRHEIESNSTPQTVLDNEQMLLRHQRVAGNVLPRRVQLQRDRFSSRPPAPPTSSASDLNVGHAITKSSTAEEVSESKQLLFRKHIGDQRATKLQNLRNKYMRRDPSDDGLSSNYPNSSRSTVRDTTYSSISSAVASQDQESSWKETEEIEVSVSLAKSDSFDYDNSVDRLRIRQMETLWSRSSDDAAHYSFPHGHTQPMSLQPISETIQNPQRTSPYTGVMQFQSNDTFPSESENFSESDNIFYPYHRHSTPVHQSYYPPQPSQSPASPSHPPKIVYSYPSTPTQDPPAFMQFFGPRHGQVPKPSSPHSPLISPTFRPSLERWKSEARQHLPDDLSSLKPPGTSRRSGSEGPPSPVKPSSPIPSSSPVRSPTRSPIHSQLPSAAPSVAPSPSPQPEHSKRESSETSSKVSVIQGYTHEHLQKARKFGSVVGAVRKPGHHVGPTKNPNCFCEHCQRWKAERFQIRNRAFSVGDKPIVLKRPNFKGK